MDIEKYTDDTLAIVVVSATLGSYFIDRVSIPTEPMMLVLGYFFGKKLSANRSSEEVVCA